MNKEAWGPIQNKLRIRAIGGETYIQGWGKVRQELSPSTLKDWAPQTDKSTTRNH